MGYTIQLMQTLLKEHPEFLLGRQLLRKASIMQSSGQRAFFSKILYSFFLILKARSQKNPFVALEILEKLLEKDPYNRKANWLLHTTALACNIPETATFALETLLEGHPKDIKGMHQLAEHYIQQNQHQQAFEVYDRILKLEPTDLVALKASKNTAVQVSMQRGGWNEESVSYRELRKTKN